jgi:aminoglycoside phosphotransferase (APT) family kinase protein
MPDLGIYLENVLQSLRDDVRPAVTDPKARAAVTCIEQIIARMLVNVRGERDPEAGATLVTPVAHYGGAERLHSATEEAARQFAGGGSAAVRDLLGWEREVISRVHLEAMALIDLPSASNASTAAPSVQALARTLETYLRRKLNAHDTQVLSYTEIFGGRSKITSMATVARCPGFPDQVVMRRDAGVNLTGGMSVTLEAPLLRCLHEYGVPVPTVYLAEADSSVIGSPFMLMERMPGRPGRIYHSPQSPKLMHAVAAALATLHRVPLDAVERSGLKLEALSREALLKQINEAEAGWKEFGGPPSVSATIAFDWLKRNIDRAFRGNPSLIHGDILFHNILSDDDRLCAFLDWELARVSYPAADLGYIRMAICRVMSWEEFMASYRSAGGPDVPEDAVDFYAIWSNLYMSKLSAYVQDLVRKRQITDVTLTAVCLHDIYVWAYDLAHHLLRTAEYS